MMYVSFEDMLGGSLAAPSRVECNLFSTVNEMSASTKQAEQKATCKLRQTAEDPIPQWKLLANLNFGSKKLLYVKRFAYMLDLKHELSLLHEKQHHLHAEGISDKAWILGPNDEIVTSYTVVDGRLRVDSCFQEDEEYESYDYES